VAYGRFKPETFFVSSIILRAKHELTSKAASKSVLLGRKESVFLDRSLNTKSNKASDAVSKRLQQLQEITIAPVRAISGQVALFLSGGWQQR